MTDHAYVALIETPQQFDQVEDFVAALVREGAGYANDIGVLDAPNHFDKGALLVLFTADRGLIDACFHLEFGFDGPLHFEHLDAFETEGDEFGAEIVGFRSLADEAGEAADTPEKVFAHVRALKGWARGAHREAHADPVAYEEAADDWNRRLSEMLPVAAVRKTKPAATKRAARTKVAPKRKTVGKPDAKAKTAGKRAVRKAAGRKAVASKTAASRKSAAGKKASPAASRKSSRKSAKPGRRQSRSR
ncbi:MAG: hypothetical protein OEX15_03605 [Gammaproteobacteria bacterium]|nr:hypothetical protein [Gammaproteobacteria bacterium]